MDDFIRDRFRFAETKDMAAAKLVALLLLIALVCNFTTGVFADAGINGGEELKLGSDGGVASYSDRTRELKGRDELVAEKEKLLQERQDKVASLETEVSSLRKKGSSDSVELLSKAQERAAELEKQLCFLLTRSSFRAKLLNCAHFRDILSVTC